jgi:hypothetical protein
VKSIENIMRSHKVKTVLEDCRFELSVNFDAPAISIISFHATRLNLTYEEFSKMLEETEPPKCKAEGA